MAERLTLTSMVTTNSKYRVLKSTVQLCKDGCILYLLLARARRVPSAPGGLGEEMKGCLAPPQNSGQKNQPVLQPFLLWQEGRPPPLHTQSAAHSKKSVSASPSPRKISLSLLPYKLPPHTTPAHPTSTHNNQAVSTYPLRNSQHTSQVLFFFPPGFAPFPLDAIFSSCPKPNLFS